MFLIIIKKKKITVSNTSIGLMKVAGNFHGYLSLKKQKKITKLLKLMQFPCSDALSYANFCEGRIEVVIQCRNQIWDIHPLIPIINAAGGIVTNWKNKSPLNGGNILVASNKAIHKKMLKLLKPAI